MKLRTISRVKNLKGKRVLMRVDYNVPLTDKYTIADDARIRQSLPTVRHLIEHGATVLLMSHLGRPEGTVDTRFSLKTVAKRLERHIRTPVQLIPDYWEDDALHRVERLKPGAVAMLENTRFHPGETQNDDTLAAHVAQMGDIYVDDAFGVAHRAHMSLVGITAHLPSYAGFLMQEEVRILKEALSKPKRPFLVIIGGAKTPEKIRVIERLLDIADSVFVAGAVANTFLAMWGVSVGVSRVDHEMIEMARAVFWKATRSRSNLLLPSDVVVSNGTKETKPFVLPYDKVTAGLGIYDIGPKSREELGSLISQARCIIWNGPMGLYEDPRFVKGTKDILTHVASSPARTIIGGGDTISMVKNKRLLEKLDHISTGGGAMLEFMEKGSLPALDVLV